MDYVHDRIVVVAVFYTTDDESPYRINQRFILERRDLEDCGWRRGMDIRTQIGNVVRNVYSRLCEDALMQAELAPRREVIDELVRLNASPSVIGMARADYRIFENHVRQHHSSEPPQFGRYMYGYHDPRAVYGSFDIGPGEEASEYRAQQVKAGARAIELLKSWLNPDQLKQYNAHKYFDVIGSDSGKTYRIKFGRQMNVFELDAKGNQVCGHCALPSGGLAEADVMLGQKIFLETKEGEFLKIANRFDDRRGGSSPRGLAGYRANTIWLDESWYTI